MSENHMISSSPSQKVGMACPAIAKAVDRLSIQP